MEFHNYPSTQLNIFEPADKNYFISSGKYTYLCTYEEISSINKYTFPGAFVLVTYKRYALVSSGQITFLNKDFEDGHSAKGRHKGNGFVIIMDIPAKYYIHTWNDTLESYELRSDTTFNSALNPIIYKSAEEAMQTALELSKENQQTYLIAQWFDDFDRH